MADPFYKPVLDALKTHGTYSTDELTVLLEFLKDVDAGNTARLPITAQKLSKKTLYNAAIAILPDSMFLEGLRRLLLDAREAEFRIFFDWNVWRIRATKGSRDPTRSDLWGDLLALVPLPTPALKELDINKAFDRYRNALVVVLAAHAISERAPVPAPSGGEGEMARIQAAIVKLTTGLMYLFNRTLEAALTELGKRGKDRGKKLAELHTRWSQIRHATFERPPHDRSVALGRLSLPLTVMKSDSGQHRYLDAFPPNESRSFRFSVYNRDDKNDPKPESTGIGELLRVSSVQLRFFLSVFGESFPPDTPARKKEFAERRSLIDKVARKVKSFDIRSEDGMAEFLCAFFTESVAVRKKTPTPQARMEAWAETIEILAGFARTQTMHSEFNLAEEPMYLGLLFPRSLHGVQLYDCGVYAVKAAYVLLKLGACITRKAEDAPKPDAAFLLLPIHIGLVVKIDEFPPVVVQNDQVKWLAPDDEKRWRKEWDSGAGALDPDPPDAVGKDRKFIEDYAAQLYVSDLDMPIIRIPLGKLSSPAKKREIWKAFESTNSKTKPIRLFSDDIEKSGAKNYQFDIRFLTAQENERKWHNKDMVPFWNVRCHALWVKLEKKLATRAGRVQYERELEALLKPVSDAYDKDVKKFKNDLSDEVRASTAVGKQARRITASERVTLSVAEDIGPLGEIRGHLRDVRDSKIKVVPTPGFATEDGFLRTIGGW